MVYALSSGCSPQLQDKTTLSLGDSLLCDADDRAVFGSEDYFVHDGVHFRNGFTQSDERSFSGKYSCKLDGANPYGMAHTIQNVNFGEEYIISVWRDTSCAEASLAINTTWGQYFNITAPSAKKGAWEKLNLHLRIQKEVLNQELNVYVWLPDKNKTAYFDQLTIRKVRDFKTVTPQNIPDSLVLNIKLKPKASAKIAAKRKEALEKTLLISNDNDYVKTTLTWRNEKIKAKLRLKGDWTDHLIGEKWSMRIKTKKSRYWKDMRTFSIQSPTTRYFLDEWVYHEWLRYEGLLSPRYDFAYVSINKEMKGVFAVEEHFTKNLIESQSRREGPILKFDEDELWSLRTPENRSEAARPVYEASEIQPFKAGSVFGSESMTKQFELGQNLMHQFKHQLQPPDKIFDLEALAKYMAIVDVCRAYHSLIWHNQRWYFNPVTARLEPIGFDGYADDGPATYYTKRTLLGFDGTSKPLNFASNSFQRVFMHRGFFALYMNYVQLYASEAYLENFFNQLEPELKKREQLLQTEYKDYHYDSSPLFHHAAEIRTFLENTDIEAAIAAKPDSFEPTIHLRDTAEHSAPVPHLTLMAYEMPSKGQISVQSFHNRQITVVGGRVDTQKVLLQKPVTLPAYAKNTAPLISVLQFDHEVQDIIYRSSESDQLFETPVINHAPPQNEGVHLELTPNLNSWSSLVVQEGNTLNLKSGTHRINRNLIIPPGLQLQIGPGTNLDLVNKAAIISYSPVLIAGTETAPVLIHSSDRSGQGLTVIQADQRSKLEHVQFDHLSQLDHPGWTLTGAVTFYESDVTISHVRFSNNHCEDALNTVRSDFKLANCAFERTRGDAFDADFCTGSLQDCSFNLIGNDGIDFSGSNITASNCVLKSLGDKGVSMGEHSIARLENIKVSGAKVGLTAKDRSKVTASNSEFVNCQFAYAAFQKKPEFGPASIHLTDVLQSDLKATFKVQAGSVLSLKDGRIVGTENFNIDLFFY